MGNSTYIRYKRRRSSKVLHFNAWNFEAEPGDLMVDANGNLFRLEESSSWQTAAAGILYPRKIKPHRHGTIAKIKDGEIYWIDKNSANHDTASRAADA